VDDEVGFLEAELLIFFFWGGGAVFHFPVGTWLTLIGVVDAEVRVAD